MPDSTPFGRPISGGLPASGLRFRGLVLGLSLGLALMVGPAPSADAADDAAASWSDTLLSPLVSLSAWVSRQFSHEERFIVDEIAAFKRAVDTDLSAFDTLVEQAGFHVESISVGASLIPRISLSLVFVRRLSEPEKTALMARVTDTAKPVGTIQRSIIMTLLNAAESVYALRSDGYRLSGVDIDVDLIPDVTFIMSKD